MDNRIALALVAVNVVMFIVQASVEGFTESFLLFAPDLLSRPWILVTSMFLHGSVMHLFGNMFALFLFGMILESIIGSRKFTAVYFISGIIAGLIASNFYTSALGASGAIFGVLGMLAALRPKMIVWTYGAPMPMVVAAAFWLFLDIAGVFFPSNVANVAHIAGMAFGVATGIAYRGAYVERKTSRKKLVSDEEINSWEDDWM